MQFSSFWYIYKVATVTTNSRTCSSCPKEWWSLSAVTPLPQPSLYPSPGKTVSYLLSFGICLFWTFHIKEIIQYVAFYFCLFSFSMFSRFSVHGSIIFHCNDTSLLSVYSLAGLFPSSAVMCNTATNLSV